MSPRGRGPIQRLRPKPSWLGLVAVVVVAALLAMIVPAADGAGAQVEGSGSGAGTGGFDTQFGVGHGDPAGSFSADGAWGLVESGYSLEGLDPFSGSLMGADVTGALSPDYAITEDLLNNSDLAFDPLAMAEQARRQAEAKLKAAQAKAKAGGLAFESRRTDGAPAAWERKNFSACGNRANTAWEARIETVDTFELLCRAAAAEGVNLTINSGFRDPARQRQLFAGAVAKYGSANAAAKWVARPNPDGSCTSRHCAGIAIDVSQAGSAGPWMHTVVGCFTAASVLDRGRSSCGSGERAVKRVQLYGFVLPMSWEPWHIELGIPVDTNGEGAGSVDASCDPPRSLQVPQMISAVFRCRLAEVGITGAEADTVVAEAVVVSKCESGWNAEAVVFGGKYLNTPHPKTGSKYSAAGVFQFIRGTADRWVPGGYAKVKDPVANIDGAARYYISGRAGGRPWTPWACASVNDGFAKKSVLPQFGGPPLPEWARQY